MDIVITENFENATNQPCGIGNTALSSAEVEEVHTFKETVTTPEIYYMYTGNSFEGNTEDMNFRIGHSPGRTNDVVPENRRRLSSTYETFSDRLSEFRHFNSCSAIDKRLSGSSRGSNKEERESLMTDSCRPNDATEWSQEAPNYCIETDLETSHHSKIIDSHTAYRKILDGELIDLKVQLAKVKAYADQLEFERNRSKTAQEDLTVQMKLAVEESSSTNDKVVHLEQVVSQLQTCVREANLERATLQSKHLKLENKYHVSKQSNDKYKLQNRKLKKELTQLYQHIEGKSMEVQGLKSENDWLKKQLWPDKNNDAESDDSSDENPKPFKVTGMRQLLSPRMPSSRRRRRRSQADSILIDKEIKHEQLDSIPPNEDAEDRTTGYSSLTDFHFRGSSAPENKVDNKPKSTRKVQRQNSLIRKLAIRHGVADLEDESHSQSHYTLGPPYRPSLERRVSRRSSKSLSGKKSRDREHETQLFMSPLTRTMQINNEAQTRNKESSNGKQWNFWDIFGGNGGVKSNNQGRTEEDSTRELSEEDSSIFSDEIMIKSKFRSSLSSQTSQLATAKKIEQQAKSGTVLVPKSFITK